MFTSPGKEDLVEDVLVKKNAFLTNNDTDIGTHRFELFFEKTTINLFTIRLNGKRNVMRSRRLKKKTESLDNQY